MGTQSYGGDLGGQVWIHGEQRSLVRRGGEGGFMGKLLPPLSTLFPTRVGDDVPQCDPGNKNVSDGVLEKRRKPIKATRTHHMTCSWCGACSCLSEPIRKR